MAVCVRGFLLGSLGPFMFRVTGVWYGGSGTHDVMVNFCLRWRFVPCFRFIPTS